MNSLSEYHWEDFNYDWFAVNIQLILVGEDDLLFTDYDHVLAFLKPLIRDLHKYSDLLLEFKQMHGHIDCHLNEVNFVKCVNRSCCNEFRSKVAKEILGAERGLTSPSPNRNLKGHYNNYLQEVFNEEKSFGYEDQPTAMEKNLGRCNFCPHFSFKSATERTRHQSMFHRLQKQIDDKEWKFRCPFAGWQLGFASHPSLSWHQTAERHRARDSPVQLQKIPSKRKSHQTISDMLRQVKTIFTLI